MNILYFYFSNKRSVGDVLRHKNWLYNSK